MVQWTLLSPCTATHQTRILAFNSVHSCRSSLESVMLITLENNGKICDSTPSWSFCVTVCRVYWSCCTETNSATGNFHSTEALESIIPKKKDREKGTLPIDYTASKMRLPTCCTEWMLTSICCILRRHRETFQFESTSVPWTLTTPHKVAKLSFLKGKL